MPRKVGGCDDRELRTPADALFALPVAAQRPFQAGAMGPGAAGSAMSRNGRRGAPICRSWMNPMSCPRQNQDLFFRLRETHSITRPPKWGQPEVIHLRNLPARVLDSRGAVRAGDTTSSPR